MKRTIRLAIVFAVVCYAVCVPLSALATTEEPPLVLPSLLINRVVAGITGQSSYEYIELYNPNSQDVTLNMWRVRTLRKDGASGGQEFTLTGTVKAHGYVLLAGTDSQLDNFQPDFRLNASSIVTLGGIIQLLDGTGAAVEQLRWGDTASPSLSLVTGAVLERVYAGGVPSLSGNNMTDFTSRTLGAQPPRAGGYVPYVSPVNHCDGAKISEIAANVANDAQFVELYNETGSPLMLDGCLLQTNRSTTKSLVLEGTLNPGDYRALFIAASELTLTKTTSGTVYLLSSDGEEEVDVRSYDGLAADTSWAWVGGETWRQTFARTPGSVNMWQEFLPCESGYERNVDTGRCRKVVVVESPAECVAGQYRNPETNRCRSATLASALIPCKVGQYRNSETNRCRTLATTTSELTPCREGQERNPDTNRCRMTSASIPQAAFAIEPVAQTGKAFAGWWALGGVGTLAAGYGAWEWRREMLGGVRKIGAFFISGK